MCSCIKQGYGEAVSGEARWQGAVLHLVKKKKKARAVIY